MSKMQSENTLQNDSVDSGSSITFKIDGLIGRLVRLQKTGNIAILNTPLDKLEYIAALKEYNDLSTKATGTTQFPSPADKAAFLSDLNKCQAVIAFRAGSKDANTYLKEWEKNSSANSDDFMTELQTILESRIQFLQETGNITKVNESLDSSKYESNKNTYDNLVKTIKNFSLSKDVKAKLSFDLNKCQAISAFRVLDKNNAHSKLAEHNTHLLKAYKDYSPGRNQSIIELGQWNMQYKALTKEQQDKMSASSLLEGYFKNLTTVVGSYLTQEKYDDAITEMEGLENSKNMSIIMLRADIHIAKKDFSTALNYCKEKLQYEDSDDVIKNIISKFYKELAEKLGKNGGKNEANEANKIAESLKPEAEHQKLMTLSREQQATNDKLSMELARQKQETKELADKYAAAIKKLTDIETKQIIVTKQQEMQAKQDAELERFEAEFTAQQQSQFQVKKEQINALTEKEPTAPELPPTYSSIAKPNKGHKNVAKTKEHQDLYPFDMLDETIPTTTTGTGPVITTIKKDTTSTGTAPVATTIKDIAGDGDGPVVTVDDSKDTEITTIESVVTNAVPAEINDITTILHSEKPDTDRVTVLCKRAIGKQADLYKIIDESVVLLSLASAYLKLGKPMEAKEAVNKVVNYAIKNNKNAYDETEDSSVLNLIAEEYKEEGLLKKSVEACKKIASQPGYKPCAESYQLLKGIGEEKKDTDKELALEALKVAKGNAADDIQKNDIHMTIIKRHLTSKNLEDAKKEYTELLDNVSYQTVYKFAKTPEEVKHLSAVDDELAKYKSLSDEYKANPTLQNASDFYRELWGINKCEIQLAAIMETNLRLQDPEPREKIGEIIRDNPGNKIISHLNECYTKWNSQIKTNDSNAKYVEAIGDIDHCLFGGEW